MLNGFQILTMIYQILMLFLLVLADLLRYLSIR